MSGMKELRSSIVKAELCEYDRANAKHDFFSSNHEGYSVLLEEFDELIDECNEIRECFSCIWDKIKVDELDIKRICEKLEFRAINAACEATQVAAMARKMIASQNQRNKEDSRALNKWISVKDKLPNVNERVIVMEKYGAIHRAEAKGVCWTDMYTGFDIYNVEYWMPDPELPDEH